MLIQYSMNVARPQMITATERKPQSLVEVSGRAAKPNRRIPYWREQNETVLLSGSNSIHEQGITRRAVRVSEAVSG
jgi:hypothetical protein